MTIKILEQLEENLVENADDDLLLKLAQKDCRECRGQGVIKNTDYVPYGSTSVPLESTEICDCIWNGEQLPVFAIAGMIRDNLDKNQLEALLKFYS